MSYSPLFHQGITQCLYVLKKKKKKAYFNKLQFLASNPKETNKQKIMYYWVGQKVGLGFSERYGKTQTNFLANSNICFNLLLI